MRVSERVFPKFGVLPHLADDKSPPMFKFRDFHVIQNSFETLIKETGVKTLGANFIFGSIKN